MSLKDQAIEAYEKRQLNENENTEKERKKFIEGVKNTIESLFGQNLKIEIIEEINNFGEIAFLVDGLKMRGRRGRGYYEIYLVQKCQICNSEFEEHVVNIENIGKALKDGHSKIECDRVLESKKPKVIQTTEERLVEVLRDFIAKNSNIG